MGVNIRLSPRFHGIIMPIFKFFAEVRKVIYTTNAIESLNYYRVLKGAYLCIQKNKRILHYGYIEYSDTIVHPFRKFRAPLSGAECR